MGDNKTGPGLILASRSPRRKYLLEQAGLKFKVIPSQIDESLEPQTEPDSLVKTLAEAKATGLEFQIPGFVNRTLERCQKNHDKIKEKGETQPKQDLSQIYWRLSIPYPSINTRCQSHYYTGHGSKDFNRKFPSGRKKTPGYDTSRICRQRTETERYRKTDFN